MNKIKNFILNFFKDSEQDEWEKYLQRQIDKMIEENPKLREQELLRKKIKDRKRKIDLV